jgi:hypothetical protein
VDSEVVGGRGLLNWTTKHATGHGPGIKFVATGSDGPGTEHLRPMQISVPRLGIELY